MVRLFALLVLLLAAPAAAQTITVGSLTLSHCIRQYDGFCGTLQRPLDPTGRVPGSIGIGFEFYPHTGSAALGTIVAEEGGPGYATTGSRDGYVRLFTPLRTGRDILLVDKRGTGRSGAIDCKRLQRGRAPGLEAARACGLQLGPRAWLYGSDAAADDLAAVLAALQLGPVDYYGDSYGTFFGQVMAARHPEALRTMVLDSAYPVLGGTPFFASEIETFPVALERVCARSAPCAAQQPSITERLAALLAALRAAPVSGLAPGANGEWRSVTADPAALFLVVYEAGNTLTAYRDLDAASRAYFARHDAVPLLRLVAEALDASGGAGPANQFSVGLATAVMCQDYHTLFDLRQAEPARRRAYARALAETEARSPGLYAPFLLADALAAPTDPEALDTCVVWPAPPADATPAFPVPAHAAFPKIPVLVLAGELDTVTSPKEAAQTTALFPEAWFVVVRNRGHETAIGNGGVNVPPDGADLAGCVGPIVLRFVASGGDPGDTGCALRTRPIRTVPDFAATWRAVAPAASLPGNAAADDALALASAAAETVGDAVARYAVASGSSVRGLRGGRFSLAPDASGIRLHLDHLRWTPDLAVSGEVAWNQLDGHIRAQVALAAPGHAGTLTLAWQDRDTDARLRLSGQIDGVAVEAERLAP